jgi:hypothetical protein
VNAAYARWSAVEPDDQANAGPGGDCLVLGTDGFWYDDGCNVFRQALCEAP